MNQRINNTPEANALMDIIYKYGCVALDQLAYLMPPSKRERPNYHVSICNHLMNSRTIIRNGNSVLPVRNNGYSQEMIDSLWVMIDMLSADNDEVPIYEKTKQSFKAEHPESICFIKDAQYTVKIIPITSESQVPMLSFIQERFYAHSGLSVGEEDNAKCLYVLIIRDKLLLNEIGRLGFRIPHKIAYLSGNAEEKPEIKYFGNTSAR